MLYPGMPSGPAPKTTHGRFKGLEKIFVGLEMEWSITYKVDMRQVTSQRRLNQHRREVNKELMRYWHEELRPAHFQTKAVGKYKYQPRTRATHKIKRELYGHVRPLRQKGAAESITDHIKAVRATAGKATLIMHGPWYLAQRTKRKAGGLSPDLKDELTRVDQADAMKIAHRGGKLLAARLELDKKTGVGAHVVKG